VVREGVVVLPDEGVLVGRLGQPGASFVTLTRREGGELRGCTGSLEAMDPLALNVCYCAVQTALYDYRFPPVSALELEDIEIEVSVLTPPQALGYASPEELLEVLEARKPGVLIQRGEHRATFLPQVWERLPEAGVFLGYLCMKAGLGGEDYLEPGLEVFTYQVEKFSESELFSSVASNQ
jgi:AmmeMemoRadiSam system protein A